MAENPIAIRADEETKELFEKLAQESGTDKKVFFKALLDTYELNQTKIAVPILKNDIDEIQQLTGRMNSIFVNIGERVTMWEEQHIRDSQQSLESKDGLIDLLQQQIQSLKVDKVQDEQRVQAFIEAKETAENKIDELESKVKQLQDMNSKNDDLIASYKGKNEELSVEVKNLLPMAELNNSLKSENELLKKNLEGTGKVLSELQEASKLKDMEFKDRLQSEVEKVTNTLNFEKDKAILDLKVKHQEAISDIRERHSDKINELLQQKEKDLQRNPKIAMDSQHKPSITKQLQTDSSSKEQRKTEVGKNKQDKDSEL